MDFIDTAVYHYNGDYKKISDKFKKLRKDVFVHTLHFSYLSNIHHMIFTHKTTPEDDETTNKNNFKYSTLIHEQYPLTIQNLFCMRVLLNTFMTNLVAFNVQERIKDNDKDTNNTNKDNKLKTHTFILILGKNKGKKPGEDLFAHGFMYGKYKIFLNANIQKEIVNVYKMEGNQFHLMKKMNSFPILQSESYKGIADTTIRYQFVPVTQTAQGKNIAQSSPNKPKFIPYQLSFDPTNYVPNEHYDDNLYNINSNTLHPVELFNAFEILQNEAENIRTNTFFSLRPFYKQNVQLFAHRSYVYTNPYDYYYRRVCNGTEQTVNAFDKLLSSSKYGKRYVDYKKHSITIKNKKILFNYIFQPFIVDVLNLICSIVVKDEYVSCTVTYEEFMEMLNLSYSVQIVFHHYKILFNKNEFKPTLFTTLCHRNEYILKSLKYNTYYHMKKFLYILPKFQWARHGLILRKYTRYLGEDKHKYFTEIKQNKRKKSLTNNHKIIADYEVEKFKETDRKVEILFICAIIITSIMLFIVLYLFIYLRIKLQEKKREIKVNLELIDRENNNSVVLEEENNKSVVLQ